MQSPPNSNPSSAVAGRCLVVFGTKGGVGKTVVATNLAIGLAQRMRQPVCLVDLDLMAMGDVTKTLKLSPRRTIVDLVAMLKKPASPGSISLEGTVVSHPSGIDVLACPANPAQVNTLDPKSLAGVFQILKQRYSYVIIDAGRAFTDPLIAAFDEANLIMLVVTPDIVSLYQTKWALGVIESLLFPSLMIKLVLNRAESRGGVGSDDVRVALPCEVIGEIPSDGRTVGTSINEGNPLLVGYGNTKVAEAYRRLCEVLVARPELYITHHPGSRQGLAATVATPSAIMSSARLYMDDRGASRAAENEDEVIALKRKIHERLVEELDLKKLDLAALANQAQMGELRLRTERVINNLLAREMGGMLTSHEVRSRLVKEIADEALGLGPLEELLEDPMVTDILVNNKDEIYIERQGKLQLTAKKFMSNDQVRTVIERIVAPIGRRIDESNPMVDARLPDGSRVNAIIPPLSIKGPVLSIRKFGRERFTLDDLIRLKSLSESMASFLRACVVSRRNIIISGGTGSGKTTMLNVLSAFIPNTERIITIEDAVELKLAQRHWISLEGRPSNVEGRGAITVRDLFRNALRMRPDRIIIGECRGEETLDMLQAMNTGHDGSLTTVHANSPRDVVSRLDSMVLMSNIELPVRAIREMVASAIHMVIHTARMSDGSRKITSVGEVVGLTSEAEVIIEELFGFQQTGLSSDGVVHGEFVATGRVPRFFHEFQIRGIDVPESVFAKSGTADGQGRIAPPVERIPAGGP